MSKKDLRSEPLFSYRCMDLETRTDSSMAMITVESTDIIFLSTPFYRAAADRLERVEVCAHKIGSEGCKNYPLIGHIGAFGKPMIVSTGMDDIIPAREVANVLYDPCTSLNGVKENGQFS